MTLVRPVSVEIGDIRYLKKMMKEWSSVLDEMIEEITSDGKFV